ncbi:hypothetical protein KUTeg_010480 [Tegillarca granosa]|uniref:Uncharacterized protein n=1 Tax=Tegillarca granosa TaxID=220873 RepID=A0ABQ9FB80_TEGGR|nr:hypothetical protein KUTeg_010480 [Tegillarca granosa]
METTDFKKNWLRPNYSRNKNQSIKKATNLNSTKIGADQDKNTQNSSEKVIPKTKNVNPKVKVTEHGGKAFLTDGPNLQDYTEALSRYNNSRQNSQPGNHSLSGSVSSQSALTDARLSQHLDTAINNRPISATTDTTLQTETDTEAKQIDDSNLPLIMRRLKLTRAAKSNPGGASDAPSDMSKIMAMTKIVKAVKTMHVNRQQRLEASGNVTTKNKLRKFMPEQATDVIFNILKSTLQDKKYEPKSCAVLSKTLCEMIKNEIKSLKFPRYKFVSHVTIGQRADQSILCASKCVWNVGTDDYACSEFSNSSLFASAVNVLLVTLAIFILYIYSIINSSNKTLDTGPHADVHIHCANSGSGVDVITDSPCPPIATETGILAR